MPIIALDKKTLPFLLDGASQCTVSTAELGLNTPIPVDGASVFDVTFTGATPGGATLGSSDTVKVGVSARTAATLTPIFAGSKPAVADRLKTYGLDGIFQSGAESPQAVLCFELLAGTDTSAATAFTYGFLKTSTELMAGADAGFAYVRAVNPADPIRTVVPAFFSTMRLPEQVTQAPQTGEALFLQYGGYLRLATTASAGYELSGTKALSLGQIVLSEKYGLSIVGRIGMTANIAGRFSILVTAADRPGWARVQVKRHRARELKIAADVNVGFRNDLDLPANSREFLGALLGVNAKSYIAVFDRVLELSDFKAFEQAVDGLAKKYIEAVIGRSFDALNDKKAFKAFMGTVARVVESYETVDDRAVTLFDRYFDRLEQIVPFLERLERLTAGELDTLRKELNPELWTVLSQLTDGDPLGFLLGRIVADGTTEESVPILQQRARQVLEVISGEAHTELRRVIGVAKRQFGLDTLFGELSKLDTVDELKARSNEAVGQFVRRLVGRTLSSSTDLKDAFDEVHAVLLKIDEFPEKLFSAFKEATNSSYKLALHTEYSRATESDALIDLALNLADPRGTDLLKQAARGDFEQALALGNTDVVRLREGLLTHRTVRTSAFKVNVLGWHLDYQYEGIDRVITEASQRLVPSEQGITVYTTLALELDRVRKQRREQEQTHVNFLFQALGQSAGVIPVSDRTREYVIDALNAFTARYQLTFTDEDTSEAELDDYLGFARDLGLDSRGATTGELAPLLPRAGNGGFGPIDTSYDIRFTGESLRALARLKVLPTLAELRVRQRMRLMLLANYLKSRELHDVAFAYATDEIFLVFREEGAAKFPGHSQRTFAVTAPGGIAGPSAVTLDHVELERLTTLYNIENAFIGATRKLIQVLGAAKSKPSDIEKVLGSFGSAMKDFDSFDQTTSRGGVGTSTVFALFHELVRQADPAGSSCVAVLRLASHVGGTTVEKLFMSDGAVRQQH